MPEITHKLGCKNRKCLSFENCWRAQTKCYRFKKISVHDKVMCKLFIENKQPNMDFLK